MNSQQEDLLDLLKDIHGICSRHGIRYFIFGGTLIGAVRNKGFLPWDDDADIMMPYEDWKRFLEVCQTELPENRFLGAPEVDENYRHIVPRFVSRDTTSVHTCQSLQPDVTGTAIDIFILDPIADGEQAFVDYVQDMYLYSSIVNYANVAATRFEVDSDEYWKYHQMESESGHLAAVQALERRLASHHAEGSRYAERWQSVTLCYERSWFETPVPIRFEDATLYAMNGIDEYLTAFYGEDWAEIPREITPAKHNAASSGKVPCAEALEYYKPAYDRDQLYEDMAQRKRLLLQLAPESNSIKDGFMKTRAEIAKRNSMAAIESNRNAFQAAAESSDGAFLSEILGDYLSEQTSGDYIGRFNNGGMYRTTRPIDIPVPDEIADAALPALLETGRIRFISKLLRTWRMNGREMTPKMEAYQVMLDTLHKATHDYEIADYQQSLQAAESLLGDFPGNAIFTKLLCVNLLKLSSAPDADAQIKLRFEDEVAKALEAWPADGFFYTLDAMCMERHGDVDGARKRYIQAAECTRNGFALCHIAEKTGYHPAWLRTPSWARKAGVPQWDGEEPAAPDNPPRETAKPAAIYDPRQKYLLGLLTELARFCEARGIDYVISPVIAHALYNGTCLPASIDEYCLVLKPKQHAKLLTALQRETPDGRYMSYMGNNRMVKDRRIRFHGLDSLYATLEDHEPNKNDTLYVSAVPLEPQAYPKGLQGTLQQWNRATGSSFPTGNRKANLYRKLTRISDNTLEAGKKLYDRCMKAAELLDSHFMCPDSIMRDIRRSYLKRCTDQEFGDYRFMAPADLEGYCELGTDATRGPWLRIPQHYTAIANAGFAELCAQGVANKELYTRRDAVRKQLGQANQAFRKFRDNFRDIKIAVKVKEVSLELLPRKDEIVALYDERKYDELSELLKPYSKCAAKFKDAGKKLCFDEDIYRIFLDLKKAR